MWARIEKGLIVVGVVLVLSSFVGIFIGICNEASALVR